MIWLASFPRSGNTFFRNVLYEVYGLASSTYHQDEQRELDPNFASFPVVKTHLLPADLPAEWRDKPSVYLIRDGRDALVSIAHHRKDIVAPGTDFFNNLLEAILAQKGSFFGGWSKNVRQWTQKADIVIRFQDLIQDPIREIEKLRSIIDLPQPNLDKLPTFKDLKFGQPQYGGGRGKQFLSSRAQKHFRKGRVGGWKEELPANLEKVLWAQHGRTLTEWGYEGPQQDLGNASPKRVMIEASKLYGQDNDGIKRYLAELINGLRILTRYQAEWDICLYDQNGIQSLRDLDSPEEALPSSSGADFRTLDEKEAILLDRRTMDYEKKLLLLKAFVKQQLPDALYDKLSVYYRQGPFRQLLTKVRQQAKSWGPRAESKDIAQALGQADLIHIPLPQHLSPKLPTDNLLLVSVHDLTHHFFPDYHTKQNIALAENGMQQIVQRQAEVLAVSQSTQKDVLAHYPIPTARIHLCYEAANMGRFNPSKRQADIAPLREKYGLPSQPYLMCLSTIEPRKNLVNTVRAFLQLKASHPQLTIQLLICGKKGWKTQELFEREELQSPHIHFTGFVEDDDLPHLYAHARALCYISHYEGFGLPLLEAMSCRTPVLYGSNSSMPEIASEGGLPADASQPDQIQAQMHRLVTDDDLWHSLSEGAWRQANRFSWLKTALETLQIYEKVIQACHP